MQHCVTPRHLFDLPRPGRPRFTISHGNKVSWLGWSLYVGYLPHYGGRFWDIQFKGERVAYELSLQEAMAGRCTHSIQQRCCCGMLAVCDKHAVTSRCNIDD